MERNISRNNLKRLVKELQLQCERKDSFIHLLMFALYIENPDHEAFKLETGLLAAQHIKYTKEKSSMYHDIVDGLKKRYKEATNESTPENDVPKED